MPERLEGSTILVISPNEWGKMHVSKHHYALELARRGNTVFFLNPPGSGRRGEISVRAHPEIGRLFLVNYRTIVPLSLRFRFRGTYERLIRYDIERIRRAIAEPIDILWSFESNLFSDLRQFGAPVVLYHPVDQVLYDYQVNVARSADLVVSVADEILVNFADIDTPAYLIGHGLADCFSKMAESRATLESYHTGGTLRAGYVGNLWMGSLDRPAFRRVIEASPDVEFHIWGPLSPQESNLSGGKVPGSVELLTFLRERKNVVLRGVVEPVELASQLADMDLFLLCYDIGRDPNGGANSHKILEYLSTGRVVVANPVSSYRSRPDLLRMSQEGQNNADLPRLFRDTVDNILIHNSVSKQQARANFALQHSYGANIDRIIAMLTDLEGCT